MKDRALVLGGGGPVGVAWEAGLLAGLAAGDVDLFRADYIQGTSAGSIVGSAIAAKVDFDQLVAFQRAAPAASSGRPSAPPDLSKLIAFMMRFPPTGEPSIDLRRELGRFSLESATPTEDQFIAMLSGGLPPGDWPAAYACTAVDTESGDFRVWRKTDGVPLARAIASSCAVPGIYPAVTIQGRRWMDGGMRSSISIDQAAGYKRVLAVAVIPKIARSYLMPRFEAEAAPVRAAGGEVVLIGPDDASADAFGPNLMDSSRRPTVVEAALAQGRAEAARIKAFWNQA
jgi:NTE family protein